MSSSIWVLPSILVRSRNVPTSAELVGRLSFVTASLAFLHTALPRCTNSWWPSGFELPQARAAGRSVPHVSVVASAREERGGKAIRAVSPRGARDKHSRRRYADWASSTSARVVKATITPSIQYWERTAPRPSG